MNRVLPHLVIALALVTVTAGCIDASNLEPADAGTVTDTPADAAPEEVPWGIRDCEVFLGLIPVDADALSDRLPDGFRAVSPQEFGLPPDPRGDAILGVEAFSCAEVDGVNGTVTDAPYASIFVPVEAPQELRDDRFTFTFLKFETLVPDAETRSLLQDHGIPALDGDVNRAVSAPTGPAFSVGLELGDEVYGLHGAMGPSNAQFEDGFAFQEWTPTPDGLATWTTSHASGDAMHNSFGYVKLDPNGWPAEVVGDTRADAYLLHGTGVVFEDAVLTLPHEG